jgi:hypothetical protein
VAVFNVISPFVLSTLADLFLSVRPSFPRPFPEPVIPISDWEQVRPRLRSSFRPSDLFDLTLAWWRDNWDRRRAA